MIGCMTYIVFVDIVNSQTVLGRDVADAAAERIPAQTNTTGAAARRSEVVLLQARVQGVQGVAGAQPSGLAICGDLNGLELGHVDSHTTHGNRVIGLAGVATGLDGKVAPVVKQHPHDGHDIVGRGGQDAACGDSLLLLGVPDAEVAVTGVDGVRGEETLNLRALKFVSSVMTTTFTRSSTSGRCWLGLRTFSIRGFGRTAVSHAAVVEFACCLAMPWPLYWRARAAGKLESSAKAAAGRAGELYMMAKRRMVQTKIQY